MTFIWNKTTRCLIISICFKASKFTEKVTNKTNVKALLTNVAHWLPYELRHETIFIFLCSNFYYFTLALKLLVAKTFDSNYNQMS